MSSALIAIMLGALAALPGAASATVATSGHGRNSGASIVRDAVARPADSAAFFSAAALSQASVPGDMSAAQQSTVGVSDVAQGNGDAAAALSNAEFVQAFEQIFRANNAGAALLGAPAGAGDLIIVFSDGTGASSWIQYLEQNATGFGSQTASAQGLNVNITDATPFDLSGLGDESSGVELHGSATIAGLSADIYVDIGFMRRGRVQYTAFMAGLAPQQSPLTALATALDSSVAAALPALDQ